MKSVLVLLTFFALPLGLRADEAARRVLAEMNFARTQPRAYADVIRRSGQCSRAAVEAIRFLESAEPREALTASRNLSRAARSHVEDQGDRGAVGHTSRNGRSCFQRISAHGRWLGAVGENIDYGGGGARATVMRLIIDDGVFGRKHRANIFNRTFRVAGVAVGNHARYGSMCVMDFAGDFIAENRTASL